MEKGLSVLMDGRVAVRQHCALVTKKANNILRWSDTESSTERKTADNDTRAAEREPRRERVSCAPSLRPSAAPAAPGAGAAIAGRGGAQPSPTLRAPRGAGQKVAEKVCAKGPRSPPGGKRSRRREPGAPVRARSRSLAAGGGDSPPLRPGSPAGTSGPSSAALRLAPLPAGARVRRGEAPRPIRGRGEEPGGPLLGGAAHRANMVAAAAARGSPRSGPFGEICQSPAAFPLLDAFQDKEGGAALICCSMCGIQREVLLLCFAATRKIKEGHQLY
ncbi:translation initiation factor IF-2-like [Tympanuchus pallidicinctus]|uniref:translation initiation factor IF-2-like n=1 Tax=Tympanuchus pallidicinctus TaxID=109042 RepID=UPI00228732DA|nr:translation initiation factor IF-2-like [Tympanuchus pallidicinctus]